MNHKYFMSSTLYKNSSDRTKFYKKLNKYKTSLWPFEQQKLKFPSPPDTSTLDQLQV